jgi:hypothetical protein
MASTIDERLRHLEDLEEIRALLTAYGTLLDQRDLAGYAALFSRQGRWTGPYIGAAEGPAAIRALMAEKLDTLAGTERAGAHHIMSNMTITIEAQAAKAWSRWTYIVPGEQRKPSLALSGHYDDVLIREDGRWKFKSRVVSGDLPGVS